MNDLMMCTKGKLDQIILRPSVTLSLSHQNKKTGCDSGPKSVSFHACITLWNLLMWMIGMMLAMKIFLWMFRMNEQRKIQKKMRKRKQKMSKS